MKLKTLAMVVASLLAAGSAQALMVNAFDMSYLETGFPFIPPGDLSGVYGANWSDLDQAGSPGLGLNNSQAFGQMIWDGTVGSTNEIPTGAGDVLFTGTPSLLANKNRPAAGQMDVSSSLALQGDGQGIWRDNSLNTQDILSIVFRSDLSSIAETGSDWLFSFAARTQFTGEQATLSIDVSTDGTNYNPVQNVQIDDVDTLYEIALPGSELNELFVRVTFPETNVLIDNVATDANLVPEPGTLLLLGAGLAGLAVFPRRKA